MRAAVTTLLWLAGLVATLPGCATRSFKDGVYQDAQTAYRVGADALDDDWQRFHLDGANLAFRNAHGGSILVHSSCVAMKDLSLDVLTNQAVFGIEEQRERSRELFTLDGRSALRTRISGTLDGVPVELALVVLKKDDCVYDLFLVADAAAFEAREAEFSRFVSGFCQLPRSRR